MQVLRFRTLRTQGGIKKSFAILTLVEIFLVADFTYRTTNVFVCMSVCKLCNVAKIGNSSFGDTMIAEIMPHLYRRSLHAMSPEKNSPMICLCVDNVNIYYRVCEHIILAVMS